MKNINKNSTLIYLQQKHRGIIKKLHDCFGIDFEKPIVTDRFSGNFTIKKVLRRLSDIIGTIPMDASILLLVHEAGTPWRKDKYMTVRINTVGEIDLSTKCYGNGLDYFYNKSDFNETRKKHDISCIVIYQDAKYKTRGAIDTWRTFDAVHNRFKLEKPIEYCDGHGNVYIKGAKLIDPRNGISFDYTSQYRNLFDDLKITDIVDKSGYIIDQKKWNLRHRALIIRNERKKNEYLETDFSDDIRRARLALRAVKNTVLEIFKAAETYQEMKKVHDLTSYYRGLADLYDDIERFEKKHAEKGFSSIEAAKKALETLFEKQETLVKVCDDFINNKEV